MNITGTRWIEEVNKKRAALQSGMAVVAVWQSRYPEYGCYTIYTNVADKRIALRMLMDRSAGKAGKGRLQQFAFYLVKENNELWNEFCAYVESGGLQAGAPFFVLAEASLLENILQREVEL
jgi:hypothetical protein